MYLKMGGIKNMKLFKKILIFFFVFFTPPFIATAMSSDTKDMFMQSDYDDSQDCGYVTKFMVYPNGTFYEFLSSGLMKPGNTIFNEALLNLPNIKYEFVYSHTLHDLAADTREDINEAFIRGFVQQSSETINEQIGNTGNTALHVAVIHNHKRMVKALLAASADFTITNWAGDTPIHIALTKKYYDLARMLINQLRHDSVIDFDELLYLAVKNNSGEDIIKNILQFGQAYVDEKMGKRNETAFEQAVFNGFLGVISRLLRYDNTISRDVLNEHLQAILEMCSNEDSQIAEELMKQQHIDFKALKTIVEESTDEEIPSNVITTVLDRCWQELPTPPTPWAPRKRNPTQSRTNNKRQRV